MGATAAGASEHPAAQLRPATPPGNDAFAGATRIGGSGFAGSTTFSGSTAGATSETGEPNAGSGEATVWYAFLATSPGLAYVVPLHDGASTAVHVYTGAALSSLSEVGLSSAQVGGGTASTPDAAVIPALALTTYYIQVETPVSAVSAFEFALTQPAAGPPANDAFENPASLDGALSQAVGGSGSIDPAAVGTTAGATTETGEHGPDGTAAAHSVWYSLDLPPKPAGVSVTLSFTPLAGQPGGLVLGAWSGTSISSLTQLSSGTGGSLAIPPGTAGRVLVSVDDPAQGWFAVALSEHGIAPPDTAPPVVVCNPPKGWSRSPDVACTATDTGSPLAHAGDASFDLVAGVPPGTAQARAVSDTRQVCDQAGNCATAGPYTIAVDRSAPVVDCTPAPGGWLATNGTVTCTASDTGSGLAVRGDASIRLSTAVGTGLVDRRAAYAAHAPVCDAVGNCTAVPVPKPAEVDRSSPVVHCGAATPGWSDRQASVTCTASDAGSGLAEANLASFSLVTSVSPATADTKAFTDSVRVCSVVGNCVAAGPVGPFEIDLTVPVVSCTLPKGWSKGDSVEVPCRASDANSGLSPASPASFELAATIKPGTDGAASTGSRRICSVAGLCATAGPFDTIGLADAPPGITCSSAPGTWQPGPVTVVCAVTATGPGLAHRNEAELRLTASVPPHTTAAAVPFPRRSVCDAVGNCAATPLLHTVAIDEQPPVVRCGPVPAGVQQEEVDVACTASDAGSGLANPADAHFTLRTSVPAGRAERSASTGSARICDAVGNCATAGPFTADVDLRGKPAAAPPLIEAPGTVQVLLAGAAPRRHGHGPATLVAPYAVPPTVGGVGRVQVACSPSPQALFVLGLTTVTCDAVDQAAQVSQASFYVSAGTAPGLAAPGDAVAGERWRAEGAGFRPGSTVTVELAGTVLATTSAGARGLVDAVVTVPLSTPIGNETVVLRGVSRQGDELLVVVPVTVAVSRTRHESARVAAGSPAPRAATLAASVALPASGPPLPPPHVIAVAGRPNGTAGPGIGGSTESTTAPTGSTGGGAPSTTSPASPTTLPSRGTVPGHGSTTVTTGTTSASGGTSGPSTTKGPGGVAIGPGSTHRGSSGIDLGVVLPAVFGGLLAFAAASTPFLLRRRRNAAAGGGTDRG